MKEVFFAIMYRPFTHRRGQTLVEYGLLLALIALLAIGAVTLLGGNISTSFSSTTDAINNGGSGGSGGGDPAEFTIITAPPYQVGSPISFDGPSGASSYTWDFGDGSGTSTLEDPDYTYPSDGTFVVNLTTNEGSYDLAIDVEVALPPLGTMFDVDGTGFSFIPAFSETLELETIFIDGSSPSDPGAGPLYNQFVGAGFSCSWTATPTDGTSSTDNTYSLTGAPVSIGSGTPGTLSYDGSGITPNVYHEVEIACTAPGAGSETDILYRLIRVIP